MRVRAGGGAGKPFLIPQIFPKQAYLTYFFNFPNTIHQI